MVARLGSAASSLRARASLLTDAVLGKLYGLWLSFLVIVAATLIVGAGFFALKGIWRLLHLTCTFSVVLLLIVPAPAQADFDDGLAAYERGDHDEAARQFEILARSDDPELLHDVGDLYAKGAWIDSTEATKWYRRAVAQGDQEGASHLGDLYAETADFVEAARFYRTAAIAGFADAQYKLGLQYEQGQGVEQDYSKAAKWFKQAAQQGSLDAQLHLANLYVTGNGVERSDQSAFKWFKKAASQGAVIAQYNIGLAYQEGRGVWRNFRRAAHWYRRAADQCQPSR